MDHNEAAHRHMNMSPKRVDSHRLKAPLSILVATILAVPILAISIFAAQARTDDIDSFLYAFYAKRMLNGQRLYTDLWDNKPPGVFWADALGLFISGGEYWGIAAVCGLAALGTCLVFLIVASRLFGPFVACIGTVLAATFVFIHDYHVGSNRPSTFYVFFELCAMSFYLRTFGPSKNAAAHLFGAGVWATCAVAFRQTAFSAPAAIVVHQIFLVARRRMPVSKLLTNVGTMLAGAVVAGLVIVGLLARTSDLSDAWHGIVGSNVGYFAHGDKSEFLPAMFGWEEHLRVLGLPLILAAGAVIYELIATIRTRLSPASAGLTIASRQPHSGTGSLVDTNDPSATDSAVPSLFGLLMFWLAAALYLALIGPSQRIMYFGVALVPLILLATHGVWLLMRNHQRDGRTRMEVIVATLWFAYMVFPALNHQFKAAQIAEFHRFHDRATPRHATVVDCIHRHARQNDSLYMWGYYPPVYWYADRPLAQRYIVTTLVDQLGPAAQRFIDNVVADLQSQPPAAIVVGPGELQTIEHPPPDHPLRYGNFAEWLKREYELPGDCECGSVWIHRGTY